MEERNWSMVREYRAGSSAAEIAARFGVCRQRVHQVLRAFGVDRTQSGAHARREREISAIDELMAREGMGRAPAAKALGLPVHPFDPSTTREERAAVRFWKRVDRSSGPDSCWPWTGPRFPYGYGATPKTAGEKYAHRVAFILHNGRRPAESTPCVLHSCDNPPCCNPAHLHEGTMGDNAHERDARGRDRFSRDFGPIRLKGFRHSVWVIEKMRKARILYWKRLNRKAVRERIRPLSFGYARWWSGLSDEQRAEHGAKIKAGWAARQQK